MIMCAHGSSTCFEQEGGGGDGRFSDSASPSGGARRPRRTAAAAAARARAETPSHRRDRAVLAAHAARRLLGVARVEQEARVREQEMWDHTEASIWEVICIDKTA